MGVNKGRGNDGTGHHPRLRGGRGSSHKSGQSNGSLKKKRTDVTTRDGNFFIFWQYVYRCLTKAFIFDMPQWLCCLPKSRNGTAIPGLILQKLLYLNIEQRISYLFSSKDRLRNRWSNLLYPRCVFSAAWICHTVTHLDHGTAIIFLLELTLGIFLILYSTALNRHWNSDDLVTCPSLGHTYYIK